MKGELIIEGKLSQFVQHCWQVEQAFCTERAGGVRSKCSKLYPFSWAFPMGFSRKRQPDTTPVGPSVMVEEPAVQGTGADSPSTKCLIRRM
jgi:hypothetical protein